MQRMLFNVAVTVSLLLCGLFASLWPLNQVYRQYVTYGRPLDTSGRRWIVNLSAYGDGLTIRWERDQRIDAGYDPLVGWLFVASRYPPGGAGPAMNYSKAPRRFLGFAYSHDPQQIGYQQVPVVRSDERQLTVPYWFLIAITAILPAMGLQRWRERRRRIKEQRCLSCGYDLRATPDRCPECGAVPPAK